MACVTILCVALTIFTTCISSQSYIAHNDIALSWEDSNAFCEFSHGTALASIHNNTQNNEADTVCTNSAQSTGCWLGGTDINSYWEWSDGTPFDYGNDTTAGIYPWESGEPNGGTASSEHCLEIKRDLDRWNDNDCPDARSFICNYPSSTIVINDDMKNIREPIANYSIGIMDILDEIHVEFDFIVHSNPVNVHTNILHIGSNLYPRLPSIRVINSTASGVFSISASFSLIDKQNASIEYGPISMHSWHHLSFDLTQSTASLSLNGSEIASRSNQSSHAMLADQRIYLSNPQSWEGYPPMDGLLRNLKITTNNAYINPFNYLCDRFPVSSPWTQDASTCYITQDESDTNAHRIWLMDKDPTSLLWTDYSIEFKVRLLSGDSDQAQAGVMFRGSSNIQHYYVDIRKGSGVRFTIIDDTFDMKQTHSQSISWNQDYTIRVKASGGAISVYLEDEYLFSESRDRFSSGSIGFRTLKAFATFKSLRIIFPNDNTQISLDPTTSPTKEPTVSPTDSTSNPTFDPSYDPTMNPTYDPTINPTYDPTINPTYDPTVAPSDDPTVSTTSGNPTANPSTLDIIIDTNEHTLTQIVTESTMLLEESTQPTAVKVGTNNAEFYYMLGVVAVSIVIVIAFIIYMRHRMKRDKQKDAQEKHLEKDMNMICLHSDSTAQQKEHMAVAKVVKNPGADARERRDIKIWLRDTVHLPQYYRNFVENGYDNMLFIGEITSKEELQAIGIKTHGHQTRIIAKIMRLNAPPKENKPDHIKERRKHMGEKDDNLCYEEEGVGSNVDQHEPESMLIQGNTIGIASLETSGINLEPDEFIISGEETDGEEDDDSIVEECNAITIS